MEHLWKFAPKPGVVSQVILTLAGARCLPNKGSPQLPLLRQGLLRQVKEGGCRVAVLELTTWRVEDWGNKKFVRIRQAEIAGNSAEIRSDLVLLLTNCLEEDQSPGQLDVE